MPKHVVPEFDESCRKLVRTLNEMTEDIVALRASLRLPDTTAQDVVDQWEARVLLRELPQDSLAN